MNHSDGYCKQPAQGPAEYSSSSISPLCEVYTPDDMLRAQDPIVHRIIIVSTGSDSMRINGDDTVNNFGSIPGGNENDHIPSSDFLTTAIIELQSIPSSQGRVHTGTNVIY